MIGRALRDIDEATRNYINALIDNSRLYWRSIIERLNQLRDLLEQEVSGLDAGIYGEQREALARGDQHRRSRTEVLFERARDRRDAGRCSRRNMNGFTMGAGAALIGLIVALVATVGTPGPVIGIGAAALAFPALIIAAPVAALAAWWRSATTAASAKTPSAN